MWIFIGPDHTLEGNDYNFAKLLSTIMKAGARCWNHLLRDWTDYMVFYLHYIKSRALLRTC